MDYCTNGTSELKEEEILIRGSIVTTRDALFPRIIGEGHQEGKEEGTDNSTTPRTPPPP